MNRKKESLYRKVNTRARNVHHHSGSDAKYDRHTKKGMNTSMKKDVRRGLDYTPLYRFLLSKVGQPFDKVFSEAVSRLDREEPIYWMVKVGDDLSDRSKDYAYFINENAYWSKLIVDENGILQLMDATLHNENFVPTCSCCTHTFNGKPLIRKYINKDGFDVPESVVNRPRSYNK